MNQFVKKKLQICVYVCMYIHRYKPPSDPLGVEIQSPDPCPDLLPAWHIQSTVSLSQTSLQALCHGTLSHEWKREVGIDFRTGIIALGGLRGPQELV